MPILNSIVAARTAVPVMCWLWQGQPCFHCGSRDTPFAPVNALQVAANDGEVKSPCACGQEDLVLDGAAEERGVGADEYCIANLNRVLGGRADYGVVAHDNLLTERDGLTLGNEAHTIPDDTTGPYPHVADECRVRPDDGRGVNARAMASALQQHRSTRRTFDIP